MDETTEALGETTGGEALCCWVVWGGSCCLGLPNEDVPAWTMRPLLRLGDGEFTLLNCSLLLFGGLVNEVVSEEDELWPRSCCCAE